MATSKEIEENNRLLKEQNELLKKRNGLSEDVLDENRDFANILRDQTKELKFQVSEKNQLRSIGQSINKIAQNTYATTSDELSALNATDNVLKAQAKLKKDLLGLESLKGKLLVKDKELQKEINQNIEAQIKGAQKLNRELEIQREATQEIANNGGVKFLSSLEDITKQIPGLRKFSKPFQDAAQAARDAAAEPILTNKKLDQFKKLRSEGIGFKEAMTKAGVSAKQLKAGKLPKASGLGTLTAGLKTLGPSLMKALGPIGLLISAVKFIVDLFIAADENTTNIAKNLGISKGAAEGIRQEFVEIAAESDNVLVNSKSLIEAQNQLTTSLGAGTAATKEMAENQVFLTKNLGIAGDKAADFQLMMRASGQNVNDVVDSTIEFANAQAASNGYLISGQEILREISNTSADIAGYYGFNNRALAQAVITSRKYGLNLAQTAKISENLLDFESSISNELEAELLSGKQLNFEKARMLALTGDSAGAAAEVLKQAQDLTDEQRKNPILMKSMAKAAGLSVEELNKAYQIEKNLKMSRNDYNDLLEKGAKLGKQELVERLGLQGASREEIQKTLTAQEKFAASLEKAKDQFTSLVDSGILDDLADVLVNAVDVLGGLLGTKLSSSEKKIKEQLTKGDNKTPGLTSRQANNLVRASRGPGFFDYLGMASLAPSGITNFARKKAEQRSASETIKSRSINVNDFRISSHPKDTLVMAGGTRFGEETNTLLKELITAVKAGGNVYMNGHQVGETLSLSGTKFK